MGKIVVRPGELRHWGFVLMPMRSKRAPRRWRLLDGAGRVAAEVVVTRGDVLLRSSGCVGVSPYGVVSVGWRRVERE